MKKLITLLFLINSLIGFCQKPTDPIGSDTSRINHSFLQKLIVQEINRNRKNLGLDTLVIDVNITKFAKYHTIRMRTIGLKHSSTEERHKNGINGGECCQESNISVNFNETYEFASSLIVNKWKESTPHWKILMNKDLKSCGVYVDFYNYETKVYKVFTIRSTINFCY